VQLHKVGAEVSKTTEEDEAGCRRDAGKITSQEVSVAFAIRQGVRASVAFSSLSVRSKSPQRL
jgi:hypothetical protein